MSAVSEADHEDWAHEMRALQTRYEVLLELTACICWRWLAAAPPEEARHFVEDLVDDIINSSNDTATSEKP